MIDLHLHTTASDGRLAPADLVARAHAAGLTVISVTDHDTVAAIDEVTRAASPLQIRVVPGIEITAVDQGRDVHLLGYFFDAANLALGAFLETQRGQRVARVHEIAARLAALGMPIAVEGVLSEAAARPGSSVGRPQLARALVRAGYTSSVQDAFDRWLATGRPAYVPRNGPTPATVVDIIHRCGGIASFAHPAVTKRDDLIEPLAKQGLDAIEVYHSDHDASHEQLYRAVAKRSGLKITGGSDFHGEDAVIPGMRTTRNALGSVTLPPALFAALEAGASGASGAARASGASSTP